MTKYRQSLTLLALFVISLLTFTCGLHAQEIIGFESRFYLFAQEMYRNGFSWFPTTYDQPYPDYPGTSTWFIYVAACLFGGLNKFTAVLPTAIASALTVVITYLIGALHSKRWGLFAVFFLFLTMTFLKSARSLALDMYLALITTWCFYLVHAADIQRRPQLVRWIFPLLVLGFAFRGPIGLVMPTGVVCIYYLLNRDIKKFFGIGFVALAILVGCTFGLLSLARHVGGESFVQDVLRMEVVGRIDNSYQPVYFYFVDGLGNYALGFPLALLVMVGVFYYISRRDDAVLPDRQFLYSLIGWVFVILLGMTIPGDKKIRYVLPMVPGAALLCAYLFVAPPVRQYFILLRRAVTQLLFLLPIACALFAAILYFYAQKHELVLGVDYQSVVIMMLFLQVALFLLCRRYHHLRQFSDVSVLLIATISFVAMTIMVLEPIEIYIDKAHAFVVNVETQRQQQHASLVFYKERPDGLPIKYLINMPKYEQPLFIDNEQALLQLTSPAYFVTSAEYFDALPQSAVERFTVVANAKMAHAHVIVFTQK